MLRNILCDARVLGQRVGQLYKKLENVERTISNQSYPSHMNNDYSHCSTMQVPLSCVAEVNRIREINPLYESNYSLEKLKDMKYGSALSTFENYGNSHRYSNCTKSIASVWKPVLSESLLSHPCFTVSSRSMATGRDKFSSISSRISSLHAKKRAPKKKKKSDTESEEGGDTVEGFAPATRHRFLTYDPDFALPEVQEQRPLHRDWQVIAYATADEYDLDGLLEGLTQQGLYAVAAINPDAHDVLHMVATYQIGSENREIYFFREGSVVFWNVAELECSSVMLFLKNFEKGSYGKSVIEEECESFPYAYSDHASKTKLVRNRIVLNPEGATDLEKYTFSNAMAISVKLGIWEASLDKYIDDIEYVSEELSKTGRVALNQGQVLQCLGQLCALRHLINLSSDLLDTPDFYWEHENLEQLYQKTTNTLSVSKRTSVMNVKLSHCIELMELLKSHLNEEHSSRLEWIIIILIMIEVGFEVFHVVERWI